MTDNEKYVVTAPGCWAHGTDLHDAMIRLAQYYDGEPEDEVTIHYQRVVDFEKIEIGMYQTRVYADEYLEKKELTLDGDEWAEIVERQDETFLMLDRALGDAEEKDLMENEA